MTEKKVTIKGVPPKWDEIEYQRLVDLELHAYRNTARCCEYLRTAFEVELFELVIEKANNGYTVSKNQPIYHGPLEHSVWMVKPESQQVEDIAVIKATVKADYVKHLQEERAKYEDKLRQQLIQAQEEKDRKAAEQTKAKQLAAIEKQVSECYAPLVIPE